MNILFLDTETTGFENNRMIQLAYKKRGEKDIFVEYYKPPVPIEFEAMGVHHITEKKVADSLPFEQTLTFQELPFLLNDHVLVAHNAPFDIGVLKNEGVTPNKFICTYKVAYLMYDYPNLKLQSLRYRWNIEIDEAMAHDAAGDVMVLEEAFEHMLKEYMAIHNVSEDLAIRKFIEISSAPTLLKTLSFGKLRGMSFEEIRTKDFSYLQWLGTLTDKDPDFLFTVNYYLNKKEESGAESVPF